MTELTDEDKAAIEKYSITDEQLKQWEQEAREKIGDQLKGEEKEETILKIIRNRISETIEKKQYKEKKKKKKVKVEEREELKLTEEDKKRIEELKHDPAFLYKVKTAIEKASVKKAIIGEDENKLNLFIKGVGARLGLPQIITIKGSSGAGKTHLTRRVLEHFFNVKVVGRLSSTALDYMDLSDIDIIVLQEAGEADLDRREFRLLSADDEGYTVAVTEVDKEGHKSVGEYKIPPKTLVTTTTAIDIPEEFSTRNEEITIDETAIQTSKIVTYKTTESFRKVKKAAGIEKYGTDVPLIKEIVKGLKKYDVLIPYEEYLGELFKKFSSIMRVRRDVDKALNFIKLSALLHQNQRERVKIGGEEFVIADISDFLNWLALGAKNLIKTMKGIDDRVTEIVRKIREIGDTSFTKNTIAGKLKISPQTANSWLWILRNRGIVKICEEGRGNKPTVYTLSEEYVTPEAEESLSKDCLYLLISGESISNLLPNLKKKEEEWFSSCVNLGIKSLYPIMQNRSKYYKDKRYSNPFTGSIYSEEEITRDIGLVINRYREDNLKFTHGNKAGEPLKTEKKDELLISEENISKYKQTKEKNAVEEEEEIELELVPDTPDEAESISTRNRQSCEVCGKVTNLVPVVRNNKTIMVCRVCREKVKREQFNERYHKPWNIGGVNLI